MIQKFRFGSPIRTDAVVHQLEIVNGAMPFFSIAEDGSFHYVLGEQDIVYGLGEQVRGINKRGWKYVSYNLDNPHHQEDTTSLYGAHNFLLISGAAVFGVFFDYPGRLCFDIGYTARSELTVSAEAYDMDVYIITGTEEKDIVQQFRRLIGRSYIAPKWAFGYGQSRWGYRSAEEIREVAENYRSRNIPIDSIYLDIDYMERFKDFTVNAETFPEFSDFCAEMQALGIHPVPIIDAGVKIEEGYDIYEEGVRGNYFCKDAEGKDWVGAVWPGRVHFPDFLNPDARTWFGEKYRTLLEQGIDGFWNDMNEPAIFYSEERLKSVLERINALGQKNMGIYDYFEFTGLVNGISNHADDHTHFFHNIDGVAVPHQKVHNLYGFNMTKAAGEAFERLSPEKRILMFSRSSYIGAHRYGGIWQGDNNSWWSHLLMNLQMLPSLNMTGFLFNGADLGGFNCDVTEDLMLRWLQLGVFTPLMRNHSALGTRQQELYRFENADSLKRMIEIRYALLPYIYSEYMKAVLDDTMMFRPLAFDFRDDAAAAQTEDQLLLGDELMIAPVYRQNAAGRYVYLPEEMMLVRMRSVTDYVTEVLPAGHHYVDAALEELIFFVRKGKAIPFGSTGQNTAQLDMEKLYLLGYADAEYLLYDDDGISKEYENPENRRTFRNT